jgi:hypothetical protein
MIRPIQSSQLRSSEHCFCPGQAPQGRQQRSGHGSHIERTPGPAADPTAVQAVGDRANAVGAKWREEELDF